MRDHRLLVNHSYWCSGGSVHPDLWCVYVGWCCQTSGCLTVCMDGMIPGENREDRCILSGVCRPRWPPLLHERHNQPPRYLSSWSHWDSLYHGMNKMAYLGRPIEYLISLWSQNNARFFYCSSSSLSKITRRSPEDVLHRPRGFHPVVYSVSVFLYHSLGFRSIIVISAQKISTRYHSYVLWPVPWFGLDIPH